MANAYTFNPNEPEEGFDKSNSNYQLASIAYVSFVVTLLSLLLILFAPLARTDILPYSLVTIFSNLLDSL